MDYSELYPEPPPGSPGERVSMTEAEGREVFSAFEVCLSEGQGPDMSSLLQKISDTFPAIAADDGCQSLLKEAKR